VHILYSL